jgi:hypothetical protein
VLLGENIHLPVRSLSFGENNLYIIIAQVENNAT